MNRETWLATATKRLRTHFKACGYTIPANVRSTCGWPSKSATSRKRKRIGECWDSTASAGDVFEIFISPAISDLNEVVDTLAHELVHATVGLKAKHGAAFKRCATKVGLVGKMTATTGGPEFRAWTAARKFKPYPHAELRASSAGPRQTTRMLKVTCAINTDYIVRMSASAFETGAPTCPCCTEPMVLA